MRCSLGSRLFWYQMMEPAVASSEQISYRLHVDESFESSYPRLTSQTLPDRDGEWSRDASECCAAKGGVLPYAQTAICSRSCKNKLTGYPARLTALILTSVIR